jgi:hypothetical protein
LLPMARRLSSIGQTLLSIGRALSSIAHTLLPTVQ